MARATRPTIALIAACAVAAGCTETIRLTRDPLDQLITIEIAPGDAMIEVTDLAPPHHTLQYTAMGRFADGTTRDITAFADWTFDNGFLGTFEQPFEQPGLFTASHAAAGRGIVTAQARDMIASAPLAVAIDATIVDGSFPPPAANLFDPLYPVVIADPTRMDIPRFLQEWHREETQGVLQALVARLKAKS